MGILLYTRSSVLRLIPTMSRVYFYIHENDHLSQEITHPHPLLFGYFVILHIIATKP